MPLVPYDPFRHLETMRRDFNRLFARDFSSLFPDSEAMMPRVDMHETDKEYMISCDLPGLERKEDVHINVHQQTLHISGTIQRDESVKEEQMHRRERFSAAFIVLFRFLLTQMLNKFGQPIKTASSISMFRKQIISNENRSIFNFIEPFVYKNRVS